MATPLCVDLDGTLIRSDLLYESFLLMVKQNPLYLLMMPFWLLGGAAGLKENIAKRVQMNPAALPYNTGFIAWLTDQHAAGRELWLCTGSNYRLAYKVADHLKIFKGVIASTHTANMTGHTKARHLIEKFGLNQFDYCGNHPVDLSVWKAGGGAIVVNGGRGLAKRAEKQASVHKVFPRTGGLVKPVLKSLRLHQWAKNVLIFVPLAAAHLLSDATLVMHAGIAFLSFSLCASSVYMLNDMLDLESDRMHHRKRRRPFASGDLGLPVGFAMAPILLLVSLLLALSLPPMFVMVLCGYYVLTVAYSFLLKRVVLVDAITLASLYTVRIVAGAAAIGIPLTFWLLLFSVFLFMSLAIVKRYAELDIMRKQGKLTAAGRGYHVDDLPLLGGMGLASGYVSVLVLALYINSPTTAEQYRHPHVIWLLCMLLLYWISRIWLITHRGRMHEDPVVFAMKDVTSILIGVAGFIIIMLAI